MQAFDVIWDAEKGLLTTRVRRALSVEEVTRYSEMLVETIATIPSQTDFRWLSDSTGYEPLENRSAHDVYRSILPRTLAEHGLRTSLLDLNDGDVAVTCTRGVRCCAIAHVHHDAEKMAIFDERLGRESERYFSDEGEALQWLDGRDPKEAPWQRSQR